MAQADGVVANASGAAVRQDINNQIQAAFTNHSGASAPSTTYQYQNWADTTAGQMKMRNGADSDWVVIHNLDGTSVVPDGTAAAPSISFSSDVNTGLYRVSADTIGFATNGTYRMLIGGSLVNDDGGPSLLWKTTVNPAGATNDSGEGLQITQRGRLNIGINSAFLVGLNRIGTDGNYINFRKNGSTTIGSISVSGTTVSYNGGHLTRWSQLPGNAARIEILRGTVLSNIDEMCEWGTEENEQLNRMQVSSVEGDANVAGVFQSWDDEDNVYTNDFYCAMTGDFVIRIAQNTTVARGDLLMSAGDGTAKPQGDDIVRSKTIAKVISTTVSTTYADGSYCVPCVLMAC